MSRWFVVLLLAMVAFWSGLPTKRDSAGRSFACTQEACPQDPAEQEVLDKDLFKSKGSNSDVLCVVLLDRSDVSYLSKLCHSHWPPFSASTAQLSTLQQLRI